MARLIRLSVQNMWQNNLVCDGFILFSACLCIICSNTRYNINICCAGNSTFTIQELRKEVGMLQDVLAVKEGAILALRSSHAAVARAASAKDVELCKVKDKLAKVCCRVNCHGSRRLYV